MKKLNKCLILNRKSETLLPIFSLPTLSKECKNNNNFQRNKANSNFAEAVEADTSCPVRENNTVRSVLTYTVNDVYNNTITVSTDLHY